ncbi:hypothetical protein [Marinigracilibium pacificum]|uniref:Uncharacterized protein n=1 Tax=Marinigracilibium pacificum TaxID=2729599 RepID=A0A848JBW2_9BACT|nr:hypothetical protein [Marinigracilibium pacificum]NMM50492.1 hypothetical protein [Marinigracilibium pacificum]
MKVKIFLLLALLIVVLIVDYFAFFSEFYFGCSKLGVIFFVKNIVPLILLNILIATTIKKLFNLTIGVFIVVIHIYCFVVVDGKFDHYRFNKILMKNGGIIYASKVIKKEETGKYSDFEYEIQYHSNNSVVNDLSICGKRDAKEIKVGEYLIVVYPNGCGYFRWLHTNPTKEQIERYWGGKEYKESEFYRP